MGVRFVVRSCEGKKPSSAIDFPFEQTRIVLGRGAAADVRIPHRTISEFHATVQQHGDAWQLADAGSTNGTLLNGRLLSLDRPKHLHDGDLIELGAYVLSFHTGVVVPEPVSAERTAELARRLLRDAYGARAQSLPAPRLCVVSGPGTGKVMEIAPALSRALVGTKPGCQLVLVDPELALEHIEVIHDLDGVLIRGVGENVFGAAGQQQRSRRLRDGDELTVGNTRLLFEEPAQVAIDALKHEPDLPFTADSLTRTETEPLAPEPPAPPLEAAAVPKPGAASERPAADLLIYALAAIVLIASALGLLLLLQSH